MASAVVPGRQVTAAEEQAVADPAHVLALGVFQGVEQRFARRRGSDPSQRDGRCANNVAILVAQIFLERPHGRRIAPGPERADYARQELAAELAERRPQRFVHALVRDGLQGITGLVRELLVRQQPARTGTQSLSPTRTRSSHAAAFCSSEASDFSTASALARASAGVSACNNGTETMVSHKKNVIAHNEFLFRTGVSFDGSGLLEFLDMSVLEPGRRAVAFKDWVK